MRLNQGYWGIVSTKSCTDQVGNIERSCSSWLFSNPETNILFLRSPRHIEPILDAFSRQSSAIQVYIGGEIHLGINSQPRNFKELSDFYVVESKLSFTKLDTLLHDFQCRAWLTLDSRILLFSPVAYRKGLKRNLSSIGKTVEKHFGLKMETANIPSSPVHVKRAYIPWLSKKSELLSILSFTQTTLSLLERKMHKTSLIEGERNAFLQGISRASEIADKTRKSLSRISDGQTLLAETLSIIHWAENNLELVLRTERGLENFLKLSRSESEQVRQRYELPVFSPTVRRSLLAICTDLGNSFGELTDRFHWLPLITPSDDISWSINLLSSCLEIPRYSVWRIGLMPVISHELAHLKVESLVREVGKTREYLGDLVALLSTRAYVASKSKSLNITLQVIEMICDLLATRVAGPAFLYASLRILSMPSIEKVGPEFELGSAHPPTHIRVIAMARMLEQQQIRISMPMYMFYRIGLVRGRVDNPWTDELINEFINVSLKIDGLRDFTKNSQNECTDIMSVLEDGKIVSNVRPLILINSLWNCVFDSRKNANEIALYYSLVEWCKKHPPEQNVSVNE